ncbi:hypothetical protein HDU77_006337 [Chytriomyces hyalinus]|nr:hypothetical protein HDU77_006337 [Chytriomyces hyalinus]
MFSSVFQDEGAAVSNHGEISPLGVSAFPPILYNGNSSDALFDWQNTICAEAANRASLENGQNPIHDYHITSPEAAFLTCLSEEFNGYFAAQADAAQYSQSVSGQSQNTQLQTQLQLAQSQQVNHILQNSDGQHGASRLLEPLDAQLMISMADVLPLGQTFNEEMKTPPLMLSEDVTLSLADKRPKDKKLSRERTPKKAAAAATPVSKNIAYMNLLHLASAADVGLPEFLSASPGVEMSLENVGAPDATSEILTAAASHENEIIAPDFSSFRSGLRYTEQIPNERDLQTPETPSEFAFLHDTDSQDLEFHEDCLKLEPTAFVPRIPGPQQLQQYQQPHALLPQHHPHSYHIQSTQHSNITRPSPSSAAIRNKREKSATHTPRPPNSFIIYRKEKHAELMSKSTGTSTLNNNVISKIVGTMWKQEPPEIKAMYAAKAQEEKRIHMLKHPDYKYRPKKSPPKQSSTVARASSVSVTEQTNPMQRFVKMQPLNHPHPYPPLLSGNNMQQSHQNSFVGGSIAALPPPVPGSGSHGVGGMGMSVSALEDLQYCQMGADFFPMHQAMYAGGYPGFDQSVWADGGDAGNGFVYWAQAQMQQQQQQQQQQPPSKGVSFDAQGS